MSRHTVTLQIIRGGEAVEVEVECDYSPGHPGCWYLPNGDPGDPPEPAEMNVISARDEQGRSVTLDEDELGDVLAACEQQARDWRDARAEDAADAEREARHAE